MDFACWTTGAWAAGSWVVGSWCPGAIPPTPTPSSGGAYAWNPTNTIDTEEDALILILMEMLLNE